MELDEDDLRYLSQFMSRSAANCEEDLIMKETQPKPEPWSIPALPHRRTLHRQSRDTTSASARQLDHLRLNFILQHIPHLAHSLYHFESRVRAGVPVIEVFYECYDKLAVDQRVKHMPYFIPERLDMVKVDKTPGARAASGPTSPTQGQGQVPSNDVVAEIKAQRKPASFDSDSDSAQSGGDAGKKRNTAPSSSSMEPMDTDSTTRSCSPPPDFNAPHAPCDWDEFERMVRWARVLPNRKAQRDLRKEVLVETWTDAILAVNHPQWSVPAFHCLHLHLHLLLTD